MFRRRLVSRTAIFLAGSLLLPYVSQIYPPLDLDLMLVFFGLMFFVALGLAILLDRRARKRLEIEAIKRVYWAMVPLPLILAAGLFANGRFDSPKNISYHPTIVDSRYYMKGIVRGSRRLFVISWRPGQHIERLAVDADDFERFHEGDPINVGSEPGAVGIPWFYGVYRR